jgi:hypothetical protein
MEEYVTCEFCGAKLPKESPDELEPSYFIDKEGCTVCLECYECAAKTPAPKLTEYPEEKTYWVDEVFTGSYYFTAEWICDNKYRGHWVLSSSKYTKLEEDDLDAAIDALKREGAFYIVAEVNGERQVWTEA